MQIVCLAKDITRYYFFRRPICSSKVSEKHVTYLCIMKYSRLSWDAGYDLVFRAIQAKPGNEISPSIFFGEKKTRHTT